MRAVRPVVVTLSLLIGGYLFGLANGVHVAIQERREGWNITPLPSHPVAHIVLYVTCAVGLQLLSAWLLMPRKPFPGAPRFLGRYLAMVALCLGGCIIVTFVLLFIVMALLDAGVI
jgi:hypothetical protein